MIRVGRAFVISLPLLIATIVVLGLIVSVAVDAVSTFGGALQ